MGRLVEALELCLGPHLPGAPPPSLAAFKRDIRDFQVWCSSCMIATEGDDPIGVLIGAKREKETLVHRIAIRPGHLRRGHGRHLLASLSAKLAILGPPRLVAEIPEARPEAAAFFEACGYAPETTFTDYVFDADSSDPPASSDPLASTNPSTSDPPAGSWLIPVSVADLEANNLIQEIPGLAWERAPATLRGRADLIEGIGLATEDRIAAFLLYRVMPGLPGATIAALRADDAAGASYLVASLAHRAGLPLRYPVVAPGENPAGWLEAMRWREAGRTVRFAATARPG
jgi:GNAT superfamily N-acetyltransferase